MSAPMDRAAAELFLAALFVETTDERLEALRNCAAAARSWEGLVAALEGHGVLALFLRNLAAAGVEVPPAIAPAFEARLGEVRRGEARTRLTLQRFLAAASRRGVEATLVGASALCHDLYPEPLRRLGELELWVSDEHLGRSLAAAAEAGLLPDERALPAWWYRGTRTALPLVPTSPVLRGLALRPRLHHPSLLLAVRELDVVARRRRVPFEGFPLFLLDPLDGLLELATSLAARAGEGLLLQGRRHVLAAAASGAHALRLGQLLDARTAIEARHAAIPPAALLARAREWNAEPALCAVVECIQMGLGFLPGARDWTRALARGLARASAAVGASSRALFRPDPIERLPEWLRPTDAFLAARHGLPAAADARALRLLRLRHVAGVVGQGIAAGAAYPLALLQRRLERAARRRAWATAQSSERLSDVNEASRAAARVEQQKPIAPRKIQLPSEEESVARYPDRYEG
jgi:hypothetical protein